MNKFEYFKFCMQRGAYRSKGWVISAFSVVTGDPSSSRLRLSEQEREIERLRLRRDPFGRAYFNDDQGASVYLEDVPANTPAFSFKEQIQLKAGDEINLDRDVDTTYGAWLFNNVLVVYPFGNKIPYSPNGHTIKQLEKLIEARLTDDPGADAPPLDLPAIEQPIYVREYIKYNEAAGSLTGYTQLCVPAATPYTVTIDPSILKRRDELLAQYKDQLSDPVIQARISNELIQMDRDWIAKDPERGFYYRDKSFDVVRKSLFLFQGSETGFGIAGAFIPQSLDEGVQLKSLPDLANSQRNGSYSRGAQTALGGEATKFNLRMFQNSQVLPESCGTKVGKPVVLTKKTAQHYIGHYYIHDGQTVRIDEDNLDSLIGQTIELRSPMFCHAPGANFCAICVGDRIASTPDALATYAADIGSTFMNAMMKSVHGRALKTALYSIKDRLK